MNKRVEFQALLEDGYYVSHNAKSGPTAGAVGKKISVRMNFLNHNRPDKTFRTIRRLLTLAGAEVSPSR
jgi:hypothetical protein